MRLGERGGPLPSIDVADGLLDERREPRREGNRQSHLEGGCAECELGGEKFSATEVTDPDEHARLFALGDKVYAGWRDYRDKTATVGRQIPIFRLERR